jgi:tetratricopeptide (TPR) repeat protein/nucleoside phosphorylase
MITNADVLIVTAIKEEYDQLLEVNEGAAPLSRWEERTMDDGRPFAVRQFLRIEGGVGFLVVATWAVRMGETATAIATSPFISRFKPRALAMCGVCAGRRGDTQRGDVVAADQVWSYEPGKVVAHYDPDTGERTEVFKADTLTHQPNRRWVQAIQSFSPRTSWLAQTTPPQALEPQADWILQRLAEGVRPIDLARSPDRTKAAPDWKRALDYLLLRKWIDGDFRMVAAGQRQAANAAVEYPDGRPIGPGWKFRWGPMATGTKVVEDEKIFDRLAMTVRKVLAVEMEANAIGAIAGDHDLPFVVMKGVMDHGDQFKDDRYKAYAARASAECLVAFLRANLPVPQGASLLDPMTEPPNDQRSNPASLLGARYACVDWIGRESELSALDGWSSSLETVAIRLYHGAGGQGKTRLLAEHCERLRRRGWQAGFLRPCEDRAREANALRELAMRGAAFVVLDYAESDQDRTAALLRVAAELGPGDIGMARIRLVLLARNAGEWWAHLKRQDDRFERLMLSEPIRLAEVPGEGVGGREQLYQQAKAQFSVRLGRPLTGGRPDLSDARFGRPLYLLMAALRAADGAVEESIAPADLLEWTLNHEERFWWKDVPQEERHELSGITTQVLAVATIRGGLSQSGARDLLVDTFGLPLSHALRISRRLNTLYGDRLSWIAPLEPDVLGEAIVWRALNREGSTAVFEAATRDATPVEVRHAFQVLAALTELNPTDEWIRRLIRENVTGRAIVAFEASRSMSGRTAFSRLGDILTDELQRGGDLETARTLLRALYDDGRGRMEGGVSLRHLRGWASDHVDSLFGDGSRVDLVEKAWWLNERSVHLSEVGRHAEALTASELAVRSSRALWERDSSSFRLHLARHLGNYSSRLSAVGRLADALAAAREAVAVERQGDHERSDEPALCAKLLGNLALRLFELRQFGESIQFGSDAVARLRTLVEIDFDECAHDLAGCLLNLGAALSASGETEGAVRLCREAVDLWDGLVRRHPDLWTAELATSLSVLGAVLFRFPGGEDALEVARRAVGLHRKLAAHNDAFRLGLARSLHNLGVMLSKCGREDEARVALREATERYRVLTDLSFPAHAGEFADSLGGLWSTYPDASRSGDAILILYEEVRIRRALFVAGLGGGGERLASSLFVLGAGLVDGGNKEKGVELLGEAVGHYRVLASSDSDLSVSTLASCLKMWGMKLFELGRRDDAISALREAVTIFRLLFTRSPASYSSDYAKSIHDYGGALEAVGRFDEASVLTSEAVGIQRTLVAEGRDQYVPDLGRSLHNLGLLLSRIGKHKDAVTMSQEAVQLRRLLAEQDPERHLPDLAVSLSNLGCRLSEVGESRTALAASREALAVRRALAVKNPAVFLPAVARSLLSLGAILLQAGKAPEAIVVTREATQHLRALARQDPDAQLLLAVSLRNQGAILSEIGRRREAKVAHREAGQIKAALSARRIVVSPEASEGHGPSRIQALGVIGVVSRGSADEG